MLNSHLEVAEDIHKVVQEFPDKIDNITFTINFIGNFREHIMCVRVTWSCHASVSW